jgi:hypothetical protein
VCQIEKKKMQKFKKRGRKLLTPADLVRDADYRTRNRLILLAPVIDFSSVTAEVASSSLVVPAILS